MSSDDQFTPRLCHVRRWPDFNGYGFNLHAEKGKVGQFIGAIDPGSPAEAAGLKQGDRIVEVNGTNVGNENHQQVVQRIKAVPNETKLLVVDSETDAYFQQSKSVIRGDMQGVVHIEAEDRTSNGTVNNTGSATHKARLCKLKIWSDFQGYGFNLHAEKNKPGQYIGKVDEGSPSESAGLREHDKIIEVNGDNIASVNHQGVVGKIKSDPNAVRMLVLDPEALTYFEGRGIVVTSDSEYTDTITCSDTKPSTAPAATPTDHPYTARLCHVRAWPDSQGYGFNMHTQKSKPGQFIGKVDADSPAAAADLREGDRIIEVNGDSVVGGDHALVVQKIKAVSGETKLLVLDAAADDYFQGLGVMVTSSSDMVVYKATPQSRELANGTDVDVDVAAPQQVNGDATSDEPMLAKPEPVVTPKSPVTVGGIEFAASAKEARQRMSKKRSAKDDARSMKDKYELFQRM